MAKLIALTSTGPLSGKSTLAKRLAREYEFIHADHSRTLVVSFVMHANAQVLPERSGLILPLTVEDVYKDKEFYRTRLQGHGNRIGFNDPALAKEWMLYTLFQSGWFSDAGQDRDVVFDSFRGEAQAQALRELGFTLVQLHIGEDERMRRAMESGVDYARIVQAMIEHPELELGIKSPDITLNGEADVEYLARLLVNRPAHLRELDARG